MLVPILLGFAFGFFIVAIGALAFDYTHKNPPYLGLMSLGISVIFLLTSLGFYMQHDTNTYDHHYVEAVQETNDTITKSLNALGIHVIALDQPTSGLVTYTRDGKSCQAQFIQTLAANPTWIIVKETELCHSS